MKKDLKVTLSYDVKHEDTYLIQNETKEQEIILNQLDKAEKEYKNVK